MTSTHPHYRPFLGMVYAFVAYICYSGQDTLVSLMARVYHPLFVTWVDAAVALSLLAVVVIARKGVRGFRLALHTHQLRLHLIRAFFFVAGTALVFTALPHVPLPNMYVIIFISPLLGSSFSGIFLKEHIGRGKFLALLLGFAGILIALKPGPEGFNIYALFIFAAACMYAVNALLNRHLARKDSVVALSVYPLVAMTVLVAIPAMLVYKPVALEHILPLVMMGVCLASALFLNAHAYRYAPIYLIAPCWFTQLIWGSLAQKFIYGQAPEKSAITGGLLVVVANLLIIFLQYRTPKKELLP